VNLQQLSSVRRWHVAHRDEAPLECHAWDAMLTLWVLGWTAVPPVLLLDWTAAVPLCAAMFFAPASYVALRRRLHAQGRLRCDWLPVLR